MASVNIICGVGKGNQIDQSERRFRLEGIDGLLPSLRLCLQNIQIRRVLLLKWFRVCLCC